MADTHTLGRLLAATNYAQHELRDEAGNLVAVIAAYQPKEALRLAACWNACQGVPMDWLESWANPAIREMFGPAEPLHSIMRGWMDEATKHSQRAADAVAQRDELLAALQIAVRQNEHDMLLTGEELRAAQAVIAKHQPQAGKGPAAAS